MTSTIFLSLCIPTNGVTEWVVPVLDSIYREQIAEELFEVVVTDNGENKEFFWKMKEYSDLHQNLIYKKTTANDCEPSFSKPDSVNSFSQI